MAGALRKTMEYLGLAEADERYDDYDYDPRDDEPTERRPEAREERTEREPERQERTRTAEVTPLPQRAPAKTQRTPVAQVVSEPEVGEMNRITTIHPRTYNEAKDIGEAFRAGIPVIINLTDMEDADAKRLVDFAAGLAFGLHGSIERVTAKVFLLSPSHIEVESGEVVKRADQAGLFNQS